jgi:hypothetical protein
LIAKDLRKPELLELPKFQPKSSVSGGWKSTQIREASKELTDLAG